VLKLTTMSNGTSLATGKEEIANMVDSYYENLFGEPPARTHTLDLSLLQLPHLDMPQLDRPFTEEEVEKVVKEMPPDKAPWLDGFTGRFIAACWAIIKEDFMRALHAFYRGDMRGMPAINKAIVSLLPKMDGAIDVKDFRPLSLVHGAIIFLIRSC
jgi:hypothetical protein